jgi:hypothetical protein
MAMARGGGKRGHHRSRLCRGARKREEEKGHARTGTGGLRPQVVRGGGGHRAPTWTAADWNPCLDAAARVASCRLACARPTSEVTASFPIAPASLALPSPGHRPQLASLHQRSFQRSQAFLPPSMCEREEGWRLFSPHQQLFSPDAVRPPPPVLASSGRKSRLGSRARAAAEQPASALRRPRHGFRFAPSTPLGVVVRVGGDWARRWTPTQQPPKLSHSLSLLSGRVLLLLVHRGKMQKLNYTKRKQGNTQQTEDRKNCCRLRYSLLITVCPFHYKGVRYL